jgi:hypothetical protein
MSKTKSGPGFLVICIHLLLVLMTGGFWLVPLGIYYIGSAVTGKRPSFLMVFVHSFLTLITGGFWLLVLIIYALTRK